MKLPINLLIVLTLFMFLSCESEKTENQDVKKQTIANAQGSSGKATAAAQDKPAWINDAFDALESGSYPNIKAIAWWHEDFDQTELRIDSSPLSLSTYQTRVANNKYITTPTFTNNKLDEPPVGKIYHAAYPDFGGTEDIVTAQRITDFETLAGKNIAWAYFSDNFDNAIVYPQADVTTIKNAGRIPFIRMMPRTDFREPEDYPDPNWTMQRIINGEYDAALTTWALAAKAENSPLLIEFGTEVNGDWFSWCGAHNGADTLDEYNGPNGTGGDDSFPDGPERFRDAYRHIIDIFNAQNVDNVTWFFHANGYSSPWGEAWNDMANYYPGDSYIDWIGVSIYGPQYPGDYYLTLSATLSDQYAEIVAVAPTKPIALLEFAVTEIQTLSIEEF